MNDKLPRLLLVDDEQHVLDGLRRVLMDDYDIVVADNGPMALRLISDNGPFAVVVSDMRMPRMDGAELLSKARVAAPDTVRVLLTGHTDIDAAVRAINDGAIFRFLCKPCDDETLRGALSAAVRQHELLTAERQLLQDTLTGTVKVLIEILSLAAPAAFSRASRIKRLVTTMTTSLGVVDAWQYEVAALLSFTGFIALPVEIVEALNAGQKLPTSQQQMFDGHPEIAYRLLSNIPRLNLIASMIRRQREPIASIEGLDPVALGAALLRTAITFDDLRSDGHAVGVALERMRNLQHPATLLDILRNHRAEAASNQVRTIRLVELTPQMVFVDDVRARNGTLLVPRDREVTRALIERLQNFSQGVGVVEPLRVRTAR